MKRNNVNLFVRLICQTLIISCSTVSDRIEGKWNIADISIEGKSIYDNTEIILDTTSGGTLKKKNDYILFKRDNTFEMKTPAVITRGKWHSTNEDINLKMETGDSLLMKIMLNSDNHIVLIVKDCREKIKLVLRK